MVTLDRDPAALARRLVSRKTGLLHGLQLGPRRDPIAIHSLFPQLSEFGALPTGNSLAVAPCRAHRDLRGGLEDILLEVAERYCGAFVDPTRLLRARAGAAQGPFYLGERFPLFAEFQYQQPGWPFRRLTPDSDIFWAMGRSLVTGKLALVPAAFVFVPYLPTCPDEWLGPSTSTGMACHWSWARACLRGLFEVCERDAFAIVWANRLSPPRLRLDVSPWLAGEARVTFIDTTSDLGVPALAAVLEARWRERRLVTLGLAAGSNRVEAAHEALTEAVFELRRQRELLASGETPFVPAADFSNVNDWEAHSLVYLHPEHQPALEFLTASPEERVLTEDASDPPADEGAELLRWVRRLADCGHDVIVVDLTTRELAELGLHAVKVFVPQAVPLNADHRHPWLGHQRLYARAKAPGELNPYPHPLA